MTHDSPLYSALPVLPEVLEEAAHQRRVIAAIEPPFMPRAPQSTDLLPTDARKRLMAASQVPDQLARRIAIEEATDYARLRYPQFFQPATT